MIVTKMKNWGPFHNYLKERWAHYNKLRKESVNPYTQFELNQCKRLLTTLEREYRDYLSTIGVDNGKRYLRTIELESNKIQTDWRNATDMYKRSAYKKAATLAEEIKREFIEFIKIDQE